MGERRRKRRTAVGRGLTIALAMAVTAGCGAPRTSGGGGTGMAEQGVLDFTMATIDGEARSLGTYRGKVLLLVNVASQCGNTPQYGPLEQLQAKYGDQGFRVLGFPANNFGAQEPGTDAEIKAFCTSRYGVTFDMFSKISVKGPDIHPLYRFLTTRAGMDGDVTWNFGKFLVDRRGAAVARYTPKTDPLDPALTGKIEELLSQR